MTETWLNKNIRSSELFDDRYIVYRMDRNEINSNKSRGGGVLIAVHKKLSSFIAPVTHEDTEELWVVIKKGTVNILLGTIYIPPASDSLIYEKHVSNIEGLKNRFKHHKLLTVGDYNLPNIKWIATEEHLGYVPTNIKTLSEETLCDSIMYQGLTQFSGVLNPRGVLLDLCFSDANVSVSESTPLINCDIHHPPFVVNLDITTNNSLEPQISYFYNYKYADYVQLNYCLSTIDWKFLDQIDSLSEAVDAFYTLLYRAIDQHVPKTLCKQRKFPLWFSETLKALIFEKKRVHRQYRMSGSRMTYNKFSDLRRTCKTLVKQDFERYIESVENSIPSNIKNFWSYVRVINNNENNIPSTMISNNIEITGGVNVANLFATKFKSFYNNKNNKQINLKSSTVNNINGVNISIEIICDILANLDINKGPGPDGIPPLLLKECRLTLSTPLYMLFSKSLTSGIFPDKWKQAYVSPIFKSGNKSNPANYRPITILSAIPKVLEKIVTIFLTSQFKNVIINDQYGFQSGKSTAANMVSLVNYAQNSMETGDEVHTIYTDFSKAFDKVNIELLILKLSSLGIGGMLLDWLTSYLLNRCHQVRINGHLSNAFTPTSGVPQGSHLGPLLFNLFINDIYENFKCCHILLFADDLKIYSRVSDLRDCQNIQEDLDRFTDWCHENDMSLNVDKCHFIKLSRRVSRTMNVIYQLNGHDLHEINQVRDLGVLLDSKLNFNDNIDHVISKANKMLGFIKRSTLSFKNVQALRMLYISLVRPVLEYCVVAWAPSYETQISRLEHVQHKFLKLVSYKLMLQGIHLDTTNTSTYLNLPTLNRRRIFYDLSFIYKLMNNLINSPYLLSEINIHVPPRNTRSPLIFKPKFHRTCYGCHTPLNRMTINYNTYGANIDTFNVNYSTFCKQARLILYQ